MVGLNSLKICFLAELTIIFPSLDVNHIARGKEIGFYLLVMVKVSTKL